MEKKGSNYQQHHDSRVNGLQTVLVLLLVFCKSQTREKRHKWNENEMLPGCVTSQGSVITSPTANLKASDLDINIGSFLFTT